MKYNPSDIVYLKKYIKENNLGIDYYNKCLKELDEAKGKIVMIKKQNQDNDKGEKDE